MRRVVRPPAPVRLAWLALVLALFFGASPSAAQTWVSDSRTEPGTSGLQQAQTSAVRTPAPPTSELFGTLPDSYPWVRLAEILMPAVVNLRTLAEVPRGRDGDVNAPGRASPEVRGLGSGFIIDPKGYIVTAHHVVNGATSIEVTLNDRRTLTAKLVGSDPETDLALLKVDASELPTIPLGRSAAVKVAEPVMAIGNSFGLDHTVTVGIVAGVASRPPTTASGSCAPPAGCRRTRAAPGSPTSRRGRRRPAHRSRTRSGTPSAPA